MSSVGQKTPIKAKPTFTYAIISVTLVLLLVGVMSSSFFALNRAFVDLKESIEVEVELETTVTPTQIDVIRNQLMSASYINTYIFQGKDEAIKEFEKELNQDIVGIAGFNPLYDAFIITMKSQYSNPDSLKTIQQNLSKISGVRNVNYSTAVIELVNANVNKALMATGVIVLLLLIVAFSLIDNTIRLLMFSQRFIIRSMQLIGATKGFIIRPFLIKGLTAGVISALLAIIILGSSIYFIDNKFALMGLSIDDWMILGAIGAGLIIGGAAICLLSTYLSVNKYLNMKLDELY